MITLQIYKKDLISLRKCLPLFLMLIYALGLFAPDMTVKDILMNGDLEGALDAQSGSSNTKQIFWVFIFLFSFINYISFDRVELIKSKSFFCFALIILTILSSFFWSGYPMLTFKRLALVLIILSSVFWSIATVRDKTLLLDLIYYSFCVVAVYIVIFAVIFPYFAFDATGSFTAIYSNKNHVGFVTLSALIFSCGKYFRSGQSKVKRRALIFSSIWMLFLLLSWSKTCVTVAVLLALIYLFSSFTKLRLDYIFISTLLFIFATFFVLTPLFDLAFLGDLLYHWHAAFEQVDLTGRGEIWLLMLDSLRGHYLTGFGFGGFWGVGEIPASFDIQFSFLRFINQAHNGFLDILIQLGFTGLTLLFICLIVFSQNEFKKQCIEFKCIFIFAIIHNVTESSFFRDAHLMWFLLAVVLISSWLNLNENKLEQKQ